MLASFGLIETKAAAVKAGDVFDRLTVVAVGQIPSTYKYYAACQCSCGSEIKKVRFDSLTKGAIVSCGCIQRERATTHGMTSSGHYGRWKNMMDRCYNEKCKAYQNYGGRGIKVFNGWYDVAQYVADLPCNYFDGAELDRIDNDGDYEPGNIKWSSSSQNADNRRSGRPVTMCGKTQSLRRWSEETGIHETTIWDRLELFGWTPERALTERPMTAKECMANALEARWAGHDTKGKPPPKTERKLRTVEFDGRSVTLAELSAITGVPTKTLGKRIFERDWPVDRAIQQ